MPKIPRSTQGHNQTSPRVDKRPACLDSLCEWQTGGECSAEGANEGAVDADQFVWIRTWDSCPRMALEREREEAWDHQRNPPTSDHLPLPVLSGEGLQAAARRMQEMSAEVGAEVSPDLKGEAWESVAADIVSAYLTAVEYEA